MIRAALAGIAAAVALPAHADEALGRRAAGPARPDWAFAATGYWNSPRGEDAFGSAIVAADRGALHLEARANYEARHAGSGFVGWTFSTGEAVQVEATPIAGGVSGSMHGPIVGVEAAASWRAWDAYIEAEHVRPHDDSSYTYAWTELGWRPAAWLRLGAVGQHTRVYGGDRTREIGGFVQLTHGKLTFSTYWFEPRSSEQLVIAALGVEF